MDLTVYITHPKNQLTSWLSRKTSGFNRITICVFKVADPVKPQGQNFHFF